MSTRTNEAKVKLSVDGADDSKQNIEKVRQEIESFGASGVKNAQAISDALSNIETVDERVTQKISEGRIVGTRDGNIMLQQFQLLKSAITDAFGSIQNAPAAMQDAYKKAEAQFNNTTSKIRDASLAIKTQKEELLAGGVAWGGFGDAITKALGPQGAFAIQGLAVVAALKEGWQVGTQFAQAIGTDFTAASEAATALRESAKGVLDTFISGDGLVATGQQYIAVLKNMGDSLFGSGKALKGFNDLVSVGVDRGKALALSTDDLRAVAEAYALAQKGGADALKLFADVAQKTDPSNLAKALTDLKGKFDELAKSNKDATKAQEDLKKAHEDDIKVIETMISKLRAEIQARKDGIDALEAQKEKYTTLDDVAKKNAAAVQEQEKNVGGLTGSMQILLGWIQEQIKAYDQHRVEITNEVEGLKKLLEANQTLSPAERARVEEIQKLVSTYKDLTPEQKLHLEALIDEALQAAKAAKAHGDYAGKIEEVKGKLSSLAGPGDQAADAYGKVKIATEGATQAASDVTIKIDEAGKTITNVADRVSKAKGGFTDFGNAIKETAPVAKDYNDILDAIDRRLIAIAQHARDAAAGIRDLGASGGKGGGSSSYSNSEPGASGAPGYPGVHEGP